MSRLTVQTLIAADFAAEALRADVARGLTSTPKTLPPKWFYDARGSELFEEITRLPEYYPTRAEAEILAARAGDIAAATGAESLVELGSGSSEKTRLLLDALHTAGTLRCYVPVDVSESAVLAASEGLLADYPELEVHALVADFEEHLDRLPAEGRRLVAFLGGTIGNLEPEQRAHFLTDVRSGLDTSDALLIGVDLVKSPQVLLPAYDDASGLTARFNKNVLRVVNRELDADFVEESFTHVAVWDEAASWVEMRLRSVCEQSVKVRALRMVVDFAAGEEMRTEISAKFTRDRASAELAAAGLDLREWWTDSEQRFALCLSVPR